jgi:hypothetical protein
MLETDSDDISDFHEQFNYGTDPFLSHTDNDGLDDGDELDFWRSVDCSV